MHVLIIYWESFYATSGLTLYFSNNWSAGPVNVIFNWSATISAGPALLY